MPDFNLGLGGASVNPFLEQDNPYLKSIIDMTTGDLVSNFNRTALPASNAAMVRSGSFGNSGLQEMQRADAEMLQKNIGDTASKLRFNDYTQRQDMYKYQSGMNEGQRQFDEGTRRWDLGFDRDVFNDGYSQNMGNLQAGLGLMSYASAANTGDINAATTQQDAPLSYLQRFSQVANGLGGNGQTATSTTGTSSNPLATALGGAQLGSSWWNRNGSSTPSGGSSSSGWDWGSVGADGASSAGGWWA